MFTDLLTDLFFIAVYGGGFAFVIWANISYRRERAKFTPEEWAAKCKKNTSPAIGDM